MRSQVASDWTRVDPFLVSFGAHLRSLRQRQGLSQEECADRAGIHVTYLSGIERGHRNPTLKNVRKLAAALSVPIRDLFAFEEAEALTQA